MFIDARKLERGTVLQADVCIVGGGVAGIALALEFERRKISAVLLESGGHTSDPPTRDLYRGENVGVPYTFADGCRGRFLGGSSNCWGGWCGPLREHDMQARDWVRDSGWPFGRDELWPYYERAHAYLNLGPLDYDIERWVRAIGRGDVRRIPLPSGRVHDIVSQFSAPSRMGAAHRRELETATHVRTVLYANANEIETDAGGENVRRVQIKTLSGNVLTAEAKVFVLACGGIENARLLLASDRVHRGGLGNAHDLVGRYFADHPRLALGSVRFKPGWQRNKLYDIKFHYLNRAVSSKGTYLSAQFTLDPEVQKREGLLNAQLWFASVFPGEGTDAAEALIRTKQRLHGKGDPAFSFAGDLARMAASPIDVSSFIAARLLQPAALIKDVKIEIVCEPTPNPDSRVTLAEECDSLGMRRVRVNWQLDDQVKRTFDRTLAIFADELRSAGVAEVDLPAAIGNGPLPEVQPYPWHHLGTWHHMGTTRMHASPRKGVVDAHGAMHGVSNLFVAGSSVFPSYGANFPTITIAALSFRLADHIGRLLQVPPGPPSSTAVAPRLDAVVQGH